MVISLNIFYFQNCTLQHINNSITQRNRIGTKTYSLYSSSPEQVWIVNYQAEGKTVQYKYTSYLNMHVHYL